MCVFISKMKFGFAHLCDITKVSLLDVRMTRSRCLHNTYDLKCDSWRCVLRTHQCESFPDDTLFFRERSKKRSRTYWENRKKCHISSSMPWLNMSDLCHASANANNPVWQNYIWRGNGMRHSYLCIQHEGNAILACAIFPIHLPWACEWIWSAVYIC